MISGQDIELLGEKKFEIPKSNARFITWTGIIVMCFFSIVFFARHRSVTGNEILILVWLLIAECLFMAEFFRSRIDVYENGIVRRRLFGQAYVFVFNPYMQLFIKRRCLGFWRWRVLKQTSLRLSDELHDYHLPFSFARNEEVALEIEAYLFRESMHMLNQTYDSGETLDFGAVQLNRYHVAVAKKHLLREQFGMVDVRNGWLRIYAKSEKGKIKRLAFAKAPLHEIANFRLLCRFVEFNDVNVTRYAYRVYGIPLLVRH